MDKERMVINDNYVLSEPEKIEKVILVLGNEGPYIMIHCEKTSFRVNLVNLNGVESLSNLNVLEEFLKCVKYRHTGPPWVCIETDKSHIIID